MDLSKVEVPRLLKKAGGAYKRVDNLRELEDALAAGWSIKTPAPEPPADAEPEPSGASGITAVNSDSAKAMIAAAETVDALDALEAEEQASATPRVGVLKAIDKRRTELAG